MWTIDLFYLKQQVQLERGQLGPYWLELAILTLHYITLHCEFLTWPK